jgi:DMSO/TMAO reductase YedYZ molybdopterin-dependent catalytic subunit
VRSLTRAHATDPGAEILIAYEMNGEPLSPDHGAPLRLIVPHWYGVASVKWLDHIDVLTQPYVGEFETGHYIYQWPDRPPERVTVMRVRARITDPAAICYGVSGGAARSASTSSLVTTDTDTPIGVMGRTAQVPRWAQGHAAAGWPIGPPQQRHARLAFDPEKHKAIRPILALKLMRILRQPLPLVPTRCYLLRAVS